MVSSTTVDEGETPVTVKPSPGARGISPGNYRLVGWDMDTTGKKLIDEICQIAGYTSSSSFSQYVMPFKNLSPPARKRHNLKIVTVGKYRIMKNSKTNKVYLFLYVFHIIRSINISLIIGKFQKFL